MQLIIANTRKTAFSPGQITILASPNLWPWPMNYGRDPYSCGNQGRRPGASKVTVETNDSQMDRATGLNLWLFSLAVSRNGVCTTYVLLETLVVYTVDVSDGPELSKLLDSGQQAAVIKLLMTWIQHATVYLAGDQPVLGTVDIVSQLITEHQVSACLILCLH